jgi:hypothetical protein
MGTQHGDAPSDEKPAEGIVAPLPTGGQPAPTTPPVVKEGTPPPVVPPTGVPTPPPVVKPEEPKVVPITALHEERTKRQELEAEMQMLKQNAATMQTQHVQPQQQQQQQIDPQQIRKEIDELWDNDPKKAVQAEIMVALDWRDRVDASMDSEADGLSQKYADFGNYRTQAQQYIRSLPLEQRARPGVMELAYFIVRGQNVDTLIEQQKNELYQKFQAGEIAGQSVNIPAGSYVPPSPTGQVVLSEDQLKVANMMNLTPEAYASAIQQK